MRISRNQGIVTLAALASMLFLWHYLSVPVPFLISMAISIVIISLLLGYKSGFTKGASILLIAFHMVRLLAYLIPVYDKVPNIRQWYRSSPSLLFALPESENMKVSIEEKGQMYTLLIPTLRKGVGIFNGTHIITQLGLSTDRVILGFRDGSNIQLFRNSELVIEALQPDFTNLTGSRITTKLIRGELSATTRRTKVDVGTRSVHAGDALFSCQHCVVGFSGDRGTITSKSDFVRQSLSGTTAVLSGGTYSFSKNSIQQIAPSTGAASQLALTNTTSERRFSSYLILRDEFITKEFGRPLDTSLLLSYLSKTKMAVIGLVDRTSRDAYNRLHLYEYLRGKADFPSVYEKEKHLYEFVR